MSITNTEITIIPEIINTEIELNNDTIEVEIMTGSAAQAEYWAEQAQIAAQRTEDLENKLYKNPQDAINNGVQIGDIWVVSKDNNIGETPGQLMVRFE